MRREKRTKRYQVYVRPSIGRQLELFKPRVVSMSDYLASELERLAKVKQLERETSDEAKTAA